MRGLRIPGQLVAWGATATERDARHPPDRHVPYGGEHLIRAVDVDAGPAVVHRWLCQLSVAPYSYDLIDNLGRRFFGDIAMSYEAVPGISTRGRILVCLALGPRRRHSLGVWRILLAAGDLVMMRRQLRTLRDLAQRPQGGG